MSNQSNTALALDLNEASSKSEELPEAIINEYNRLNEKIDTVIAKIKKRKAKTNT